MLELFSSYAYPDHWLGNPQIKQPIIYAAQKFLGYSRTAHM
jgi:hypothetical protein